MVKRNLKKSRAGYRFIEFRQLSRRLRDRSILAYIFLAFVFIFFFFQFYRMLNYEGLIAGTQPYYHARIARQITEEGPIKEDILSFGSRVYIFNPYHYLLAFWGRLIGIKSASKILPFLFSITSLIFFYMLLKRAGLSLIRRELILICLITTPVFLYSALISNSQIVGITMLLIGFYFFSDKKESSFLLSLPFFFLAALFGFLNFLSAIIVSAVHLYKNPEKKTRFVLLLLIFLCVSPIYQLMFYKYGLPESPSNLGIKDFIAELGALKGVSIFEMILAAIGFLVLWKKKSRFSLLYILLLFFAAAFITNADVNIYLAFILAIFAGTALSYLIYRRWSVILIRNITVALILWALLFTTFSFVTRAAALEPPLELMHSLEWLNAYDKNRSVVFSHYKNGFWIEYFNKTSVTDENFAYAPALYERLNDSNEIFYSRNLKKTEELLEKYGITYILITPDMKRGVVWKKEEEGLLFLLRNNETFNKIYEINSTKGSVEIWKYKK